MPREQSDASYLSDMLTAARAATEFARGCTFEEYAANLLLRSAVERQIEIVGEAARRVSSHVKEQHPQIPWDKIMRQRHVLAHDYGEIEHERIWRVVIVHLPELIVQLEPLIPPPPEVP